METVLDQLPRGARVAIIRLRSLGDCVLTTPAIDVLKRSRSDLRIGVVVESRFAALFTHNPDIDAILEPTGRAMTGWQPELCLNFHGGTRSMGLTLRSGARFRAGFAHHRHSFLYNVRIPAAQKILEVERRVHTAEHLASAMFFLGAARCEIPRAKLFVAKGAKSERRPYAVLHPVASAPDKTWPAAGFLGVAKHLRTACGLEPVFIGANAAELAPFREFETVAGAPIEDVKVLMAGAGAFVGNDSGPAHMAAAFGAPAVVIFGNSDAEVWAPWRTTAEALVAHGPIASVTVEQVIGALERLKVTA